MGGGPMIRGVARLVGAASLGAAATTAAVPHSSPQIANCHAGSSNVLTIDRADVVSDCGKTLDMKCLDLEELSVDGDSVLSSCQHLVFGPAPTAAEVEEATEELQSTFLHLSIPVPPADRGSLFDSTERDIASAKDTLDVSQTTYYSKTGVLAGGHSAIYQAFRALQNPKVQDAVKSIALDPVVWKAVMTNEKVLELRQSLQDVNGSLFDVDVTSEYEVAQDATTEDETFQNATSKDETVPHVTSNNGTAKNFFIKFTSKVHNYLRGLPLLGKLMEIISGMFASVEKTFSKEVAGVDKTVASCMMLAVAVVIVVVIKRAA